MNKNSVVSDYKKKRTFLPRGFELELVAIMSCYNRRDLNRISILKKFVFSCDSCNFADSTLFAPLGDVFGCFVFFCDATLQ
jgi:hypothetical protein